jgi:hypothetical protein
MREKVICKIDVLITSWIEAFEMVQDENGAAKMEQVRWRVQRRRRASPQAASEAQVREVHALRKGGQSLRKIATLTGLGLRTVQTVTGKAAGTDRTSVRRGEPDRVVCDRAEVERDRFTLLQGLVVPRREPVADSLFSPPPRQIGARAGAR